MKRETVHSCLSRLIPHIDTARIALAGGLAIGLHVDRLADAPSRCLAADDIDFVAEDIEAVRPTVARDSLGRRKHRRGGPLPRTCASFMRTT